MTITTSSIVRQVMGFGHPPSYEAPIANGAFVGYWGGTVHQVADRLGMQLDEIVGTSDFATHDRDLHTSVGLMEAGTVVARRVACDGRVNGRSVITAEHVTRMAGEVASEWPSFEGVGESHYRVTITGNPSMRCDLDLGKAGDVWGSLSATAMRLVNTISAVVAADAGLKSALDLPLIPGRRVVTADAG
jgi:4-hydroxy-tetrahydrodipicolinate reductase